MISRFFSTDVQYWQHNYLRSLFFSYNSLALFFSEFFRSSNCMNNENFKDKKDIVARIFTFYKISSLLFFLNLGTGCVCVCFHKMDIFLVCLAHVTPVKTEAAVVVVFLPDLILGRNVDGEVVPLILHSLLQPHQGGPVDVLDGDVVAERLSEGGVSLLVSFVGAETVKKTAVGDPSSSGGDLTRIGEVSD